MAVYYDADISGQGIADLVGGSSVQFFLVHLTSTGPTVRQMADQPDDMIIRAGFIAFGRTLTLIGGVSRDYWHPPIWLDWLDARYVPAPNQNGSTVLTVVATRVRWCLFPGVAGHLYVQGA